MIKVEQSKPMITLNRKYLASLILILGSSFTTTSTKINKIVIIGGGPAAYSAAVSAANAKLEPIVIEGNEPGGQPIKAGNIKNFPSHKSINGGDLVLNMREHAKDLGAQLIDEQVTKVDFKKNPFTVWTSEGQTILAQTVIIATGSEPIKLNCPGEDKCWGKGVIVCAKCDGYLFKDKSVVIVGGGYSALREVGNLKAHTNNITLINPKEKLSGPQFLINQVNDSKIKILNNYTVKQILEKDGYVTGVEIVNNQTKETQTIDAQGVLIGLGWKPSSQIFKGQVTLDSKQQIIVTNDTDTSVPGVFAAGDVTNKARHQLFIAASSGFTAAMDAEKYLHDRNLI